MISPFDGVRLWVRRIIVRQFAGEGFQSWRHEHPVDYPSEYVAYTAVLTAGIHALEHSSFAAVDEKRCCRSTSAQVDR